MNGEYFYVDITSQYYDIQLTFSLKAIPSNNLKNLLQPFVQVDNIVQ